MKNLKFVLFVLVMPLAFACSEEETVLKLQVANCKGQGIQGATVDLFDSEEDRKNNQDILQSGASNNLGIVEFTDLEPIVYYYNIYKREDTVTFSNLKSTGSKKSTVHPIVGGEVNEYFIQICDPDR